MVFVFDKVCMQFWFSFGYGFMIIGKFKFVKVVFDKVKEFDEIFIFFFIVEDFFRRGVDFEIKFDEDCVMVFVFWIENCCLNKDECVEFVKEVIVKFGVVCGVVKYDEL